MSGKEVMLRFEDEKEYMSSVDQARARVQAENAKVQADRKGVVDREIILNLYSNDFPDLGVHVPPPSHACDDFPAATVVDMPLQAGTLDSTPGSAGLSVNAELGWSCASCSFINDPCALRCAMCTQPRV